MRVISSGGRAALASGRFHARNGFVIEMPDAPFAMWDDAYTATIGGTTYLAGAGSFTLSPQSSGGDLVARSVDIVMSGIDSRVAAQVMDEPWHQQAVAISRFVIADDGAGVIHARTWFVGFLDTVEWRERAGGTSTLVARCEDIGRELGRKGSRTRSSTDQRALYDGDAFFDHVVAATTGEIVWGRFRGQPEATPRRRLFGIF